jgi:hypothetical protein
MATQIEVGDQYYLTRAQYEEKKAAGKLVVGAQYYITDEDYVEQDENGNVIIDGTLSVLGDGVTFGAEASTSGVVLSSGWDIKIEDADLQTSLVSVLGKEIIVGYNPSLCFTANEAGSTISIQLGRGTPTLNQNFQYSTDGKTWNEFVVGITTITLTNKDDFVYFKGSNPNGVNEYYEASRTIVYYTFVMTGSISASGNIMSLIDDGACISTSIPNFGCFLGLFSGCTSLTIAPELPATELAMYCYQAMFSGCTSLTTPPKLPATTLEYCCYRMMFYGCTSLYVSDSSGSGYSKAWRIPTSGTLTNKETYPQYNMFYNCKGTRSSDDMAGASGSAYTYYTQNTPV